LSKFIEKVSFLDKKSKFLEITEDPKKVHRKAQYNPVDKSIKDESYEVNDV